MPDSCVIAIFNTIYVTLFETDFKARRSEKQVSHRSVAGSLLACRASVKPAAQISNRLPQIMVFISAASNRLCDGSVSSHINTSNK